MINNIVIFSIGACAGMIILAIIVGGRYDKEICELKRENTRLFQENTLLKRENNALVHDNELKCELNEELRKKLKNTKVMNSEPLCRS